MSNRGVAMKFAQKDVELGVFIRDLFGMVRKRDHFNGCKRDLFGDKEVTN